MTTNRSRQHSAHLKAVLQALLVTFLWSTSWVLIKIGLDDIPPLTFAGLRYTLAFLLLLPIFIRAQGLYTIRHLKPATWKHLIFLGFVYYAVTHGAQFVSIAYMPAVTANLVLGFTPVVVALLSIFFLAEHPLNLQWLGIVVSVVGLLIYFYPVQAFTGQLIGLIAAVVGMLANAVSAILGRSLNRTKAFTPIFITTISMGIGGITLLVIGILTTGLPMLSIKSWLIVAWLAVVNTAFAFTLWNHTLRTLSAMESSLINNSMSVQIPILVVLFLGERLGGRELIGLVVTIAGILLVQLARIWANNKKL
jgi:drug/metabolite transporter (DMT)-like permease